MASILALAALADAAMPLANRLFAGLGVPMVVFLLIALVGTVFWVWMLIDRLSSLMRPTKRRSSGFWWPSSFICSGVILYFFIKREGTFRRRHGDIAFARCGSKTTHPSCELIKRD